MKRSKLLVLALVAVLMVAGLLAACRPGCPGDGNCFSDGTKGAACTNYEGPCAVFTSGDAKCDC
jgi:hypothetical protein